MLSRLFAGGDSILMEQKNHATFSGAKDRAREGAETALRRPSVRPQPDLGGARPRC